MMLIPPPRIVRSRRLGISYMEMVVAICIILIIMVGVVAAFIELLRSHDQARARMEATANARTAMEVLSLEIKRATNTTSTLYATTFSGQTSSNTGDGDRLDNDSDTRFDEELMDALDDDGDAVQPANDLHAYIPSGTIFYPERPVFVGENDLDDRGIDEDLGATSATLEFDTFDVPGEPVNRRVKFYVGNDADGIPNTLMRTITGIDPITSNTVETSGPVCYQVVSFGALFWNHGDAKTSGSVPWNTEWPPTTTSPLTLAPSTVYLHIEVYAGAPLSLQELPADRPKPTIKLSTAVNVEAVLADPTYVNQRTPVPPSTDSPY